jgi:hypothetical protein
MADDKRLAKVNNSVALPTSDQLGAMLQFSENVVKSGLLPSHVKTPQAAFAIIQTGQELGIPPMAALRGVYVINGKPTCDAALMQALIYRDHGDAALMPVESTDERCTYKFKRAGWPEYQEFTYSAEDAKKAGLWGGKGPWSSYPRDMLRSRCISVIARMAFQDTVSGLYTPDELGAEVEVRDGEIQVVSVPEPTVTVQSSPVPEQSSADTPAIDAPSQNGATQQQIKMIGALVKENGLDESRFKAAWLKAMYGVESRKDLTKEQASELIGFLKAMPFAEELQGISTMDELSDIAQRISNEGITGRPLQRLEKRTLDARTRIEEAAGSSEDDPELDEAFEAIFTEKTEPTTA